jgi:hypothetical protein
MNSIIATGDNTTPAKKRLKLSAAVTPINPEILALAIARVQADTEAAAAAEDESQDNQDEDMEDDEPTPGAPGPAFLPCSLESLPPAFTSFAATITKKVTALLMMKRAKLRVISKLEQRETVPNSIRFKFELTGSSEVTGNSDFHDLTASAGMALLTCQTELKSYMVAAAQMEIDVYNKKYRAVFHQALKGFTQLLLINKGVGARPPTEVHIRELALSTLELNLEFFTKEQNFHFDAKTIYTDFKEATDDPQPPWTPGHIHPSFRDTHDADMNTITGLLYSTIVARWLEKVQIFLEKEKATLLQNTQQAFFKAAATKEAAEALAAERTMDETKMDEVISDKIANEAKSVRASLTKLEAMIRRTNISGEPSKNSKGGANNQRASNKKKTNQRQPPKKAPPTNKKKPSKNQDAPGAADNATSGNARKKSTKQAPRRKPGKNDSKNATSKR